MLGSLHPGVYANISTFITENNYIPILGQKYGQSLLTIIPMFIGIEKPLFILHLWLSFSMVFLIITTYGIFRHFNVSKYISVLGLFIVFLGNFALSFKHLWIIDTGSPLFYLGYTDSISSIGVFIVFLLWLREVMNKNKIEEINAGHVILPVIMGISWNIFSPEVILTATVLIFVVLFRNFLMHKKYNNRILIGFFVLILLVSILLGSMQGGMIKSGKLSSVYIPGVVQLPNRNMMFFLDFPFYYLKSYDRFQYEGSNWIYAPFFYYYIEDILWRRESVVWNSIRIVFFPLSGILVLFYLIKRKKSYFKQDIIPDVISYSYAAAIIFILGWFIVTFTTVCSYNCKWLMSRFLMLGYYFGLISLALSINSLGKYIKNGLLKMATLVLFMILIFTGPAVFSFHVIKQNIIANDLKDRVFLLLNYKGIIEKWPWEK